MKEEKNNQMEKIVSLCKRRGFVYPASEIYGGFSGFWDYGPYGLALKNNIKNLWWEMFVTDRENMYGIDAATLTSQKVLEASGHVGGFSDPMVECSKCKKKFRIDQLENKDKCFDCGGTLGAERQFNMMFKTHVGASEDSESVSYLRPETAQGIFTNFKNVSDSFHPKLPFGIAQMGKAFRNEISPRDFLFRAREFEQMEVEYFVRPDDWKGEFEEWRKLMNSWIEKIGLPKEKVYELEVADSERAHYSKRTIDFEYDFPFGRKELYGLAYRTDYDLQNHASSSGVDLTYREEGGGEPFLPHVIEPSLGVDRTVLAVLSSAYTEDEMNGEIRAYLKLKPALAPVKVAVFPLLKNKPELVEKAREVRKDLCSMLQVPCSMIAFDDNGNIGKRYRRQDEIGTPFCVTVDFDSLEKHDVTVRDRDTGEQERVGVNELSAHISKLVTK
ncbi:MAG: glycine--tRNA ligase [bacterium]|nr:glycine--tRNA ligase [bacterium]